MTTHDDDFARKVTGYLDHGTASMRAGTAYRLQLARQEALARLQAPEHAREPRLAGALAGAGGFTGRSGSGRSFWASGRLWIGIVLIAAGGVGYQQYQSWQAQQMAKDLVDTDVEILTSDLPIDAYVDKGFQNWLKHLDDR
jgi:hypothetical protein